MTKHLRSFAALSLFALVGVAHAQTPAAAPAVTVPPNPCEKPSDYVPVGGGNSGDIAKISKRIDTYKVCINTYAQGNNAKAAELAAQAQAYQEAGNKAIDEFNTYVQAINAKTNGPK
jgi:hypothetical protein